MLSSESNLNDNVSNPHDFVVVVVVVQGNK